MRGILKVGGSGVAIVAGLAGFWYLMPRTPAFGMFAGEGDANLVRVALSFSATIGGVILGAFYRQLRALQAAGQQTIEAPLHFIAVMFRSIDMWIGLAGANRLRPTAPIHIGHDASRASRGRPGKRLLLPRDREWVCGQGSRPRKEPRLREPEQGSH